MDAAQVISDLFAVDNGKDGIRSSNIIYNELSKRPEGMFSTEPVIFKDTTAEEFVKEMEGVFSKIKLNDKNVFRPHEEKKSLAERIDYIAESITKNLTSLNKTIENSPQGKAFLSSLIGVINKHTNASIAPDGDPNELIRRLHDFLSFAKLTLSRTGGLTLSLLTYLSSMSATLLEMMREEQQGKNNNAIYEAAKVLQEASQSILGTFMDDIKPLLKEGSTSAELMRKLGNLSNTISTKGEIGQAMRIGIASVLMSTLNKFSKEKGDEISKVIDKLKKDTGCQDAATIIQQLQDISKKCSSKCNPEQLKELNNRLVIIGRLLCPAASIDSNMFRPLIGGAAILPIKQQVNRTVLDMILPQRSTRLKQQAQMEYVPFEDAVKGVYASVDKLQIAMENINNITDELYYGLKEWYERIEELPSLETINKLVYKYATFLKIDLSTFLDSAVKITQIQELSKLVSKCEDACKKTGGKTSTICEALTEMNKDLRNLENTWKDLVKRNINKLDKESAQYYTITGSKIIAGKKWNKLVRADISGGKIVTKKNKAKSALVDMEEKSLELSKRTAENAVWMDDEQLGREHCFILDDDNKLKFQSKPVLTSNNLYKLNSDIVQQEHKQINKQLRKKKSNKKSKKKSKSIKGGATDTFGLGLNTDDTTLDNISILGGFGIDTSSFSTSSGGNDDFINNLGNDGDEDNEDDEDNENNEDDEDDDNNIFIHGSNEVSGGHAQIKIPLRNIKESLTKTNQKIFLKGLVSPNPGREISRELLVESLKGTKKQLVEAMASMRTIDVFKKHFEQWKKYAQNLELINHANEQYLIISEWCNKIVASGNKYDVRMMTAPKFRARQANALNQARALTTGYYDRIEGLAKKHHGDYKFDDNMIAKVLVTDPTAEDKGYHLRFLGDNILDMVSLDLYYETRKHSLLSLILRMIHDAVSTPYHRNEPTSKMNNEIHAHMDQILNFYIYSSVTYLVPGPHVIVLGPDIPCLIDIDDHESAFEMAIACIEYRNIKPVKDISLEPFEIGDATKPSHGINCLIAAGTLKYVPPFRFKYTEELLIHDQPSRKYKDGYIQALAIDKDKMDASERNPDGYAYPYPSGGLYASLMIQKRNGGKATRRPHTMLLSTWISVLSSLYNAGILTRRLQGKYLDENNRYPNENLMILGGRKKIKKKKKKVKGGASQIKVDPEFDDLDMSKVKDTQSGYALQNNIFTRIFDHKDKTYMKILVDDKIPYDDWPTILKNAANALGEQRLRRIASIRMNRPAEIKKPEKDDNKKEKGKTNIKGGFNETAETIIDYFMTDRRSFNLVGLTSEKLNPSIIGKSLVIYTVIDICEDMVLIINNNLKQLKNSITSPNFILKSDGSSPYEAIIKILDKRHLEKSLDSVIFENSTDDEKKKRTNIIKFMAAQYIIEKNPNADIKVLAHSILETVQKSFRFTNLTEEDRKKIRRGDELILNTPDKDEFLMKTAFLENHYSTDIIRKYDLGKNKGKVELESPLDKYLNEMGEDVRMTNESVDFITRIYKSMTQYCDDHTNTEIKVADMNVYLDTIIARLKLGNMEENEAFEQILQLITNKPSERTLPSLIEQRDIIASFCLNYGEYLLDFIKRIYAHMILSSPAFWKLFVKKLVATTMLEATPPDATIITATFKHAITSVDLFKGVQYEDVLKVLSETYIYNHEISVNLTEEHYLNIIKYAITAYGHDNNAMKNSATMNKVRARLLHDIGCWRIMCQSRSYIMQCINNLNIDPNGKLGMDGIVKHISNMTGVMLGVLTEMLKGAHSDAAKASFKTIVEELQTIFIAWDNRTDDLYTLDTILNDFDSTIQRKDLLPDDINYKVDRGFTAHHVVGSVVPILSNSKGVARTIRGRSMDTSFPIEAALVFNPSIMQNVFTLKTSATFPVETLDISHLGFHSLGANNRQHNMEIGYGAPSTLERVNSVLGQAIQCSLSFDNGSSVIQVDENLLAQIDGIIKSNTDGGTYPDTLMTAIPARVATEKNMNMNTTVVDSMCLRGAKPVTFSNANGTRMPEGKNPFFDIDICTCTGTEPTIVGGNYAISGGTICPPGMMCQPIVSNIAGNNMNNNMNNNTNNNMDNNMNDMDNNQQHDDDMDENTDNDAFGAGIKKKKKKRVIIGSNFDFAGGAGEPEKEHINVNANIKEVILEDYPPAKTDPIKAEHDKSKHKINVTYGKIIQISGLPEPNVVICTSLKRYSNNLVSQLQMGSAAQLAYRPTFTLQSMSSSTLHESKKRIMTAALANCMNNIKSLIEDIQCKRKCYKKMDDTFFCLKFILNYEKIGLIKRFDKNNGHDMTGSTLSFVEYMKNKELTKNMILTQLDRQEKICKELLVVIEKHFRIKFDQMNKSITSFDLPSINPNYKTTLMPYLPMFTRTLHGARVAVEDGLKLSLADGGNKQDYVVLQSPGTDGPLPDLREGTILQENRKGGIERLKSYIKDMQRNVSEYNAKAAAAYLDLETNLVKDVDNKVIIEGVRLSRPTPLGPGDADLVLIRDRPAYPISRDPDRINDFMNTYSEYVDSLNERIVRPDGAAFRRTLLNVNERRPTTMPADSLILDEYEFLDEDMFITPGKVDAAIGIVNEKLRLFTNRLKAIETLSPGVAPQQVLYSNAVHEADERRILAKQLNTIPDPPDMRHIYYLKINNMLTRPYDYILFSIHKLNEISSLLRNAKATAKMYDDAEEGQNDLQDRFIIPKHLIFVKHDVEFKLACSRAFKHMDPIAPTYGDTKSKEAILPFTEHSVSALGAIGADMVLAIQAKMQKAYMDNSVGTIIKEFTNALSEAYPQKILSTDFCKMILSLWNVSNHFKKTGMMYSLNSASGYIVNESDTNKSVNTGNVKSKFTACAADTLYKLGKILRNEEDQFPAHDTMVREGTITSSRERNKLTALVLNHYQLIPYMNPVRILGPHIAGSSDGINTKLFMRALAKINEVSESVYKGLDDMVSSAYYGHIYTINRYSYLGAAVIDYWFGMQGKEREFYITNLQLPGFFRGRMFMTENRADYTAFRDAYRSADEYRAALVTDDDFTRLKADDSKLKIYQYNLSSVNSNSTKYPPSKTPPAHTEWGTTPEGAFVKEYEASKIIPPLKTYLSYKACALGLMDFSIHAVLTCMYEFLKETDGIILFDDDTEVPVIIPARPPPPPSTPPRPTMIPARPTPPP